MDYHNLDFQVSLVAHTSREEEWKDRYFDWHHGKVVEVAPEEYVDLQAEFLAPNPKTGHPLFIEPVPKPRDLRILDKNVKYQINRYLRTFISSINETKNIPFDKVTEEVDKLGRKLILMLCGRTFKSEEEKTWWCVHRYFRFEIVTKKPEEPYKWDLKVEIREQSETVPPSRGKVKDNAEYVSSYFPIDESKGRVTP